MKQGHGFMTEIAIIDSFGRWGTSVFSENTAVFDNHVFNVQKDKRFAQILAKLASSYILKSIDV